MATTLSPLMKKYNALRKAKSSFCAGKRTSSQVNAVAKTYVTAAVKAGQTKKDAEAKAKRVLQGGCKMSSRVAGSKAKKYSSTSKPKRTTTKSRARK